MYKNFYMNASRIADMIQSGEYAKTRRAKQEQDIQGLIARRDAMLQQSEEETAEDPIEMISSYISSIRQDSQSARPQESAEGGAWDYSNYDDFASRLAQSESSGRSDVQITATSGGREQTMTGLFQFSEDRLRDYMNDTGASFSVEDFRADEALQRDVFAWHMADIDRAIDQNNLLERGYDRNGLRAVAHLGGVSGMIQFAETNGRYNPEDELGTSLSDYYGRFSDS